MAHRDSFVIVRFACFRCVGSSFQLKKSDWPIYRTVEGTLKELPGAGENETVSRFTKSRSNQEPFVKKRVQTCVFRRSACFWLLLFENGDRRWQSRFYATLEGRSTLRVGADVFASVKGVRFGCVKQVTLDENRQGRSIRLSKIRKRRRVNAAIQHRRGTKQNWERRGGGGGGNQQIKPTTHRDRRLPTSRTRRHSPGGGLGVACVGRWELGQCRAQLAWRGNGCALRCVHSTSSLRCVNHRPPTLRPSVARSFFLKNNFSSFSPQTPPPFDTLWIWLVFKRGTVFFSNRLLGIWGTIALDEPRTTSVTCPQ